MKSAVLFTVLLSLPALALPALAQGGDITIDLGASARLTCVTARGEKGFNAYAWSTNGGNGGKLVFVGGTPKFISSNPVLGDLVVTRKVDRCSEQVLTTFVEGHTYPTLILKQYAKSGDTNYVSMEVTLTNAFVHDYSLSGIASSITETVNYSYSKACFTQTPQLPSGRPGTATTVCYDLRTIKGSSQP